ncbi:CCA tRNA nucleotidyltransferase [Halostella sp. JP-L12]|uniref:CCA tRNA nucleotidyltransferase n=1 Tax=Halostella TaxID=1843185 RepID=UPI000EF76C85|nr:MULTISPECIES: CCA tRNA nucleotidyltransferase [Halostella]NHN48297.1 CCA tRNA nucleotidyltransferase [Halostella sp. JP-L12]
MTDDAFDAAVRAVSEEIDPDPEERERLSAAAEDLIERAEDAVADLDVDADALLVGSTARGTWVSGDRDIDVFVRFPADLDRETLEEYGLRVGDAVLPEGREEYAEHPYVTGEYEGFDVDLVPCYDVADATRIQSAVDRTPFHTQYLRERLDDESAADVRLAKQFLKGIGAYGSDLRTRGFSGYLTELLVLEYGGFRALLEAAADWHPPVRLDPEDHGAATFDDPLVVIDPTDPERNVAAVLSPDNVARVQHYARELLDDPRPDLFFPDSPEPLSAAAVREHVAERGTTPLAVRFDAPDVVEDQLYPQLRKSLSGVTEKLDRRGFDVLRAAAFADGDAVLFVELAVAELPTVERHDGPPVHVRGHATGFYEKYADTDDYGPFVDGDRYVVERDRAFTSAADLLSSDALFGVGLGAAVEETLRDGYEVLVGEAVGELAGEFGAELARYFSPRP